MSTTIKQFNVGSRKKLLLAATLCALLLGSLYWHGSASVQQPASEPSSGALLNTLPAPSASEPTVEPVKAPIAKGSDPFQAHLSNQKTSVSRPVVSVVTSSEVPNPGKDPFKDVLDGQVSKQTRVGVSPFGNPEKKP
jgi:hypothetical protein